MFIMKILIGYPQVMGSEDLKRIISDEVNLSLRVTYVMHES